MIQLKCSIRPTHVNHLNIDNRPTPHPPGPISQTESPHSTHSPQQALHRIRDKHRFWFIFRTCQPTRANRERWPTTTPTHDRPIATVENNPKKQLTSTKCWKSCSETKSSLSMSNSSVKNKVIFSVCKGLKVGGSSSSAPSPGLSQPSKLNLLTHVAENWCHRSEFFEFCTFFSRKGRSLEPGALFSVGTTISTDDCMQMMLARAPRLNWSRTGNVYIYIRSVSFVSNGGRCKIGRKSCTGCLFSAKRNMYFFRGRKTRRCRKKIKD